MERLFHLLAGAVLAGLLILVARTRGSRRETVIYGVGLIVAALIYLAFSAAGAGSRRQMIEMAGVGIFTLLAALGLRVSAWFLVFGWTAHVAWDVFLHLIRPTPFVPDWYPAVCISFDLIVAGTVAVKLRNE